MPQPGQSVTRASYAERLQMRRELVLAVVRRCPLLTASEIADEGDLGPWGAITNDLKLLEARHLVERIRLSPRTHVWRPFLGVEQPLLWDGD
jgi:hypothetical protein